MSVIYFVFFRAAGSLLARPIRQYWNAHPKNSWCWSKREYRFKNCNCHRSLHIIVQRIGSIAYYIHFHHSRNNLFQIFKTSATEKTHWTHYLHHCNNTFLNHTKQLRSLHSSFPPGEQRSALHNTYKLFETVIFQRFVAWHAHATYTNTHTVTTLTQTCSCVWRCAHTTAARSHMRTAHKDASLYTMTHTYTHITLSQYTTAWTIAIVPIGVAAIRITTFSKLPANSVGRPIPSWREA